MFSQDDLDAHVTQFRAIRYAIADLEQCIEDHYDDTHPSVPNMLVEHALTTLFDEQDDGLVSCDWFTVPDGCEYKAERQLTTVEQIPYTVAFLVPSVTDRPTIECWCRHAGDCYALDFCQAVQPIQSGERHSTSFDNGDDVQRVLGELFN